MDPTKFYFDWDYARAWVDVKLRSGQTADKRELAGQSSVLRGNASSLIFFHSEGAAVHHHAKHTNYLLDPTCGKRYYKEMDSGEEKSSKLGDTVADKESIYLSFT